MTSIDIPGYRPGTWVLDPSHSEVTFSVRHMMISKGARHVRRQERDARGPGEPPSRPR